mgnify:CR=1 FL=1
MGVILAATDALQWLSRLTGQTAAELTAEHYQTMGPANLRMTALEALADSTDEALTKVARAKARRVWELASAELQTREGDYGKKQRDRLLRGFH